MSDNNQYTWLHTLWRAGFYTLILFVVAGVCMDAYAAPALQGNSSCMASSKFRESITPLAMYCVKNAIGIAIEIYYEGLKNYIMPIVYAMIVLSVSLFGAKVMSAQVQDVTKDTMTLLFKIGIALYFILAWRDYYPVFFKIIDYINGIVVNVVSSKNAITGCSVAGASAAMPAINPFSGDAARNATVAAVIGTTQSYDLWFQFDCIVGRLFGSGATAKYAFSVSMIAIIGAALFTGAFGIMLFFVGMAALLTVFFVVMRSILTVMISYMSLAFAIILAPLFIPLFLFKQTMQYFLKWVFLIANNIVQPVFVMSFLMFAVLLFGTLLYEDSTDIPASSGIAPLNKIMGVTKNASVDDSWKPGTLSEAYSRHKLTTNIMPADNAFRTKAGMGASRTEGEKVSNCNTGFLSCTGVDLTAFANFFALNFMNEFDKFWALIMNMLAMLFLAYITLKLLYEVPKMATSITGNVALSLVSISGVPLQLDQKVASFMKTAQAFATKGVSSKGGIGGDQKALEGLLAAKGGGGAAGAAGGAGAVGGAGGGVPMGKGVSLGATMKGFAANAVKVQGKGRQGMVLGSIRGGIEGMKKGGVTGGIKGAVKGGLGNAGNNIKDMAKSGVGGAYYSAKTTVKNTIKDEG